MRVTDSSGGWDGFNGDRDNDGNTANDDYTYDANGNMTADANKGITNIKYNHLNLPFTITFANPHNKVTRIEYLYDAAGKKVAKKVHYYEPGGSGGGGTEMKGVTVPTNSSVGPATYVQKMTQTDYLAGGFQYKDEVLDLIPHAEGFIKLIEGDYVYHFNYTDHLGNVRLTYKDKGGVSIVEESNYYPFGLEHSGYNNPDRSAKDWGNIVTGVTELDYKYKYNGKEFQDELGLNMYDYGARLYDPARAGWSNIDPLAEVSRRWSPYNYCYNNPMFFVDPDGMLSESFISDLMKKSQASSTTWTNNGDGTFSSNTGEEAETGDGGGEPKKEKTWGDKFRKMASDFNAWVDNKVGKPSRDFFKPASDWATDYSEAHSSIGAGDIWREHMEPAKELYEMGFGATGVGLANTRSFAKFAPKGYTVAAEKFDYFFGRVTSSPDNMRRSLQNLSDLNEMGITSQNALIRVFNKAFSSGKQMGGARITPHGTTITKQVQIGDHALNVGFFYKGGNMKSTPSVSSIIPKLRH